MEAVSGTAGVAVGVGVLVVVFVAVAVGVLVGVLVGAVPDLVAVAVAVTDGDALVGALEACDLVFDRLIIGYAISAAMTKKTAAMMILGSCCIASPSRSPERPETLDHSLPWVVLCRLPKGQDCVTGQLGGGSVAAWPQAA
jgi:hypothetical protein